MMRTLYCTALFALTTVAQAAPSCPLAHWDDYGGTQLFRNAGQGAYVFATTHAQVDADGAPNAYHPDDVGLNCKTGTGFKGLDCPANGGYPNGDWWPSAIVPDPKNKRRATSSLTASSRDSSCRRRRSGRCPVGSGSGQVCQRRGGALPGLSGAFHQKAGTGTLGDLGYAVNLDNGKTSAFIVAEVGPSDAKWGNVDCPGAGAGRAEPQSAHGRRQAGRQDRLRGVSEKPGQSRVAPDQSTNRRPRPGPAQAVARGMETLKACGADAK